MKYALALAYFSTFVGFTSLVFKIKLRAIGIGCVCLLMLFSISLLNDTFGFIEEKVASFVSFDMYQGHVNTQTFLVQYFLAYVPFTLFQYEYTAHALNMGLQGFIFVLGMQYIFYDKPGRWIYLFLLFPAYYNFSIFGLRDPLVNLICTLLVITVLARKKSEVFPVVCILMSFIALGIRPEFSVMLIGFVGIYLYTISSRYQRLAILIVGSVAFYYALLFLPLAFGIRSTGSALRNIEIIAQFNELRHDRRIGGDGSGSHILDGALYSFPMIFRYPIQVASSFIAPLPFEIRGGAFVFAFIESLVFSFTAFFAAKRCTSNPQSLLLFSCGMLYMLLQALFAINYGNILRIRYPCYIFFLGSIVSARKLDSEFGFRN